MTLLILFAGASSEAPTAVVGVNIGLKLRALPVLKMRAQ